MNRLDEILSVGKLSVKAMGASIDELARQISRMPINNHTEGQTKRIALDYLSVCHDVLSDCYTALADSTRGPKP